MPTGPLPAAPVKGVLFDLWNTLAFSRSSPNPMEMLAEALGIRQRPGWRKILERGMMTRPFLGIREALAAVEAECGTRIHPAPAREEVIRAWNRAAAETELFDDALPVLDALGPRFRLGLLSNTQSFDVQFIRQGPLASRMDAVCLSCEEGRLKPDPEIFRTAVARLGLAPAQVLMVGDNASDDVSGGLRAGLQAAHLVRQGEAPPVPGSLGAIASLTGLSSLLSWPLPSPG